VGLTKIYKHDELLKGRDRPSVCFDYKTSKFPTKENKVPAPVCAEAAEPSMSIVLSPEQAFF